MLTWQMNFTVKIKYPLNRAISSIQELKFRKEIRHAGWEIMCDISIRDEFFTIIKAGIQLEVIACHECVKHHLLKTWSGLMKWKNKRCCHLKMGVIDKLCPHISSRPRTDGYKARMTLMTFDFWEKVGRKTLAERRRVVNVRDREFLWFLLTHH